MLKEVQAVGSILAQLLQSQHDENYHYDKRHHSKDPEYRWSDARTREFKKSVPAPDVHFWRPQGKSLPTHRTNFSDWEDRRGGSYAGP